MRLSLRFLLPLMLVVGVFAYAAVPLADTLMLRWFATTVSRVEQVLLSVGGLILVFNQFWLNVAGFAIVGVTLAANVLRARR